MRKAQEDKLASEYVKMCPPVIVPPEGHQIGEQVDCGNKSVTEYLRKKDEEYADRIHLQQQKDMQSV